MDLAEARARIPSRELPAFWIASNEKVSELLRTIRRGQVTTIATSPGGRPIELVSHGACEDARGRANFNSARAGRDPSAYSDARKRRQPVVMLLGPVHGHEVEGLSGLANLLHVLETGTDLSGAARPQLAELGAACRLLIVPVGNPDGLARFEPRSLAGMTGDDLRFWGQGTWADGSLCGWPECKRHHPMSGDAVGFLGCYYNDDGVNPMHDEFFAPMGPEAPAILAVARRAAPDIAVLLHSCEYPAMFLRTGFVPQAVAESIHDLASVTYTLLDERGQRHEDIADLVPGRTDAPQTFNLASAVYHTSGAVPATFECPHGTRDGCNVSLEDILEIQLTLYEAVLAYAIGRKADEAAG